MADEFGFTKARDFQPRGVKTKARKGKKEPGVQSALNTSAKSSEGKESKHNPFDKTAPLNADPKLADKSKLPQVASRIQAKGNFGVKGEHNVTQYETQTNVTPDENVTWPSLNSETVAWDVDSVSNSVTDNAQDWSDNKPNEPSQTNRTSRFSDIPASNEKNSTRSSRGYNHGGPRSENSGRLGSYSNKRSSENTGQQDNYKKNDRSSEHTGRRDNNNKYDDRGSKSTGQQDNYKKKYGRTSEYTARQESYNYDGYGSKNIERGDHYDESSSTSHDPKYAAKRNVTVQKYEPVEKSEFSFAKYEEDFRCSKMSHKVVSEQDGDLFAMPVEYALANCVAEDMNMGSGIAITFRQLFKGIDDLLEQRATQGQVAYLEIKGEKKRFIYYLVTKQYSNGKPTLETMFRSVVNLRKLMTEHGVKKLAIPRLGCGLDRLEWSEVKNMLEYVFENAGIEIVVCNFQQNYGKTKQKLVTKSDTDKSNSNKNKKRKGKK